MSGIVKRIKCLGADEAPLWQSNIFFFSDDASEKDIKDFLLRYVETLFAEHPRLSVFRLYREGDGYRLDYARATVGDAGLIFLVDSYGCFRRFSSETAGDRTWLRGCLPLRDVSVAARVEYVRKRLLDVFFPVIWSSTNE